MNNDEQILAALNKLSDLQEQAYRCSEAGIREPTGGDRQPAKSNQEPSCHRKDLSNLARHSRAADCSIPFLVFRLVALSETSANRTKHLKWTPAACWLMRTGTPPWALQVCLGLLKWRSKAGLRMFGQVMSRAIRSNPPRFHYDI